MDSNINKLSISALQLLEQKTLLSKEDFLEKSERILGNLSKVYQDDPDKKSENMGIMEKMSFEIRTPMNSIIGFIGLLKDSFFTMEEKDEFIGLIEKNTEQLVDLLNDLTDLSKIENLQVGLKMEKFEVNVLLLNILSNYKEDFRKKSIRVIKNSNTKLPQDLCVFTDPYQLERIVINIMKNLSLYCEGGSMEVYTDIIDDHYLYIKIGSRQLELPESIRQSISKHIHIEEGKHSFDGTGLKLSIAKSLVDLLNGEINLSESKSDGLAFEIKLPIKVCKLGVF